MRRKSPVQQWVDSLPRPPAPPPARRSSQDDISLVEDNANTSTTSPIKTSDFQINTSTPVASSLPVGDVIVSPTADEDNNVDKVCDDEIFDIDSVSNKPDASNLELDLYSSSSDVRLLKRPSKNTLLRERSTNSEGNSPRHRHPLFRESSLQSEGDAGGGSRCSSVESLLESRRVDAEAVLRGVGFGPSAARLQLARIPDRFLKPSSVKGVNTEQFIKEEQRSMKLHECGVFGYKGLTGHPHAPPSSIVAKIIERISSREDLPDSNGNQTPSSHHTPLTRQPSQLSPI